MPPTAPMQILIFASMVATLPLVQFSLQHLELSLPTSVDACKVPSLTLVCKATLEGLKEVQLL